MRLTPWVTGAYVLLGACLSLSTDLTMLGSSWQPEHGNVIKAGTIAKLTLYQFVRITEGPHVNTVGRTEAVSWIDYDNDTYPDLFTAISNAPNRLYRNNGDGSFSVPIGNIILDDGQSCSSCWADFDNDGDLDAHVGNGLHQRITNFYYVNNGDGSFTRNTEDITANVAAASVDAICADYNNDGAVDIFTPSSMLTGNSEDQLYRGAGDGSFTMVTTGAVVADSSISAAPIWLDFDGDNDPDLFVGKEGGDMIFRNDGGTFTAITGMDILTVSWSQGFCPGDYDNDGDQDMFLPTWHGENSALFENMGDGTFVEITDQPMNSDGLWSSGCCTGDFDNDGDLDIYVVNDYWETDQPDYFYINDGNGVFTPHIDSSLVENPSSFSSKATCADFDRDGDLDIFTINWDAYHTNELFLNNGNSNNWVVLKPTGIISNRSAFGAKVRILAGINGQQIWQMRELRSYNGPRGQGPLELHFGLGDAAIIDSIRIEWPSGVVQYLTDVAVNQFLAVEENCCLGLTGNVDDDPDDIVDIGDLTALIDYLFISYEEPFCMAEANVDGDTGGVVDIGDLTALIDYLFISYVPPAACP